MGKAIIVPNVSFAAKNLGKVNLVQDSTLVGISIIGDTDVYNDLNESAYSVAYNPSSTSQRGVVWSIESGAEYAEINSNGLLTIKRGANNSAVTIKATSTENESITDTKTIYATYVSALAYEEKSALIFDGNSAIDTGLQIDSRYKFDIDFTLTMSTENGKSTSSGSYYTVIVGGRYSTSSKRRDIQIWSNALSKAGYSVAFGSGNAKEVKNDTAAGSISNNERHTISVDKSNVIVDGNTYTHTMGGNEFNDANHLIIGAQNTNGTIAYNYGSRDKFHSFKIYDDTDTLVRDFVPCNYEGQSGMWDKETNTFFGNIGSGTFTTE